MAVIFSSISGRVYPAWQSAFQATLKGPILHGSELFKHLRNELYPAWQSAFQPSVEESILHGSQLFKHLWKSLSCVAVSF